MLYEQKEYRVIFQKRAEAMLEKHVNFLANVSPAASKNLREKIHNGAASLRFFPNRCPVCYPYETKQVHRRLIVDGRYQLIFSVDEKKGTVNIKYILDSRQDNRL
ncbi:MAG: type II toxin-antitoxin system RelE/ParE family toxin [Clostridiales bacterium]|jgi:plasmid stabilization system protein ParE|nr:type II toxin-antitoxin system RelE/ParE family toxin [Clostridiales bacterium]